MKKDRVTRQLTEFDDLLNLEKFDKVQEFKRESKGYFYTDVIWANVITFSLLHIITIIIFLTFPYIQKWRTVLFFLVYSIISLVGVMAYGHRYCSHKSFRANTPLKIIMYMMYAASGSYSPFTWALNHRVHHKYADTMADPYSAKRGFFYSHIGWLMLNLSPEYYRRARLIDTSDLTNDSLFMFTEKNYRTFYFIFTFLLPTFITCYFWNETFFHSVTFNIARYIVNLNCVWCINSFSHHFGDKPYDNKSTAVENVFVAIVACGEGWHNYHHKFPWDYRASEAGKINLTTNFIDLFAKIGWAYDLRQASPSLVERVLKNRTLQMQNETNELITNSKRYDYAL